MIYNDDSNKAVVMQYWYWEISCTIYTIEEQFPKIVWILHRIILKFLEMNVHVMIVILIMNI
jgi:hypothetical protein